MLARRLTLSLLLALMLTGPLLSPACSKSADEKNSPGLESHSATSNNPTPAASLNTQGTPTPAAVSPDQSAASPPKPEEVRDTMARVFNKAVAPDEQHVPAFVVGDFNGDGSEDLAVISRVGENSLPEVNNELANWTLEDPKAVPVPGTKEAQQRLPPKPVRAEKSDSLLAIIHGVGMQGWRNREARQSYLLKNGAGSNMLVQPFRKLRGAGNEHLPPLRGDAISQTLGGKSGILFWTGAKYVWYTPTK